MDRTVDVLVVGAGPGGSCAAASSARAGADTLLIEKRQEIGTPVRCGEGVSKRWLDELGIPADPSFVTHEVIGSRVIGPDGTTLVIEDPLTTKGGYTVDREAFDRHLAKEAAKAGSAILVKTSAVGLLKEGDRVVGARCEHMGERFDVRARVVIGADGFESQVGRWAGLSTHLRAKDVAACLEYTMVGVEGDTRYGDFYLGGVAPGGYGWIFWKGEDIANVGIGVNLARLRHRADTKRYLDAFVARLPGMTRGQVLEEIAGGVSVSLPLERTVADGLLLVGDAARLIDPLTGAGILSACLSGRHAGDVAAAAIEAGDTTTAQLLEYERRWRGRLEEELARHYLIKEALLRMEDETISRILRAVVEAKLPSLTSASILALLKARHPDLLNAFEGLLL